MRADSPTFARRGARVGAWILAVLGALAAWAPFLANDKPYVLVAADHGALERARTEVVPLGWSLAQTLRHADSDDDALSVARREVAAIERRLDMIDSAVNAPDTARARASLGVLATGVAPERSAITAALGTLIGDLPPRSLVARVETTSPLFASFGAVDAFAALLPFVALATYLRRRRGIARTAIASTLVAGVVAALFAFVAPPSSHVAPGAVKLAAARGTLDVERAVFAPIPYGYAETSLPEAWRPPTWLASSRMDDEGRYTSGARASSPSAGKPVARLGEPAVDSARRHLLGTDALGRDVAARTLWGGRISLVIGLAAAILLSVIGTALGAAAGFLGGFVDAAISRTIEVVLCFPAFFLVLCAVAWTDPDVVPVPFAVVAVIALVGWTTTARLVRAEALRVAASEHVLAARALGIHPLRVLARHVLPNSIGPALVAFGFAAGGAIGVESSLAFLGLGAQVPVPSWGGLVGEARGADQSWAWIAPGALVFLAVLAWVLVAEAAREALDPRAISETPS